MNFNKPFTESQQIESFKLVQNELQKTKFFIGRLSGNETSLCGLLLNNKTFTNEMHKKCYIVLGFNLNQKMI